VILEATLETGVLRGVEFLCAFRFFELTPCREGGPLLAAVNLPSEPGTCWLTPLSEDMRSRCKR
jgi:hypothetical protein